MKGRAIVRWKWPKRKLEALRKKCAKEGIQCHGNPPLIWHPRAWMIFRNRLAGNPLLEVPPALQAD